MKICSHCGSINAGTANYCSNCSAALGTPDNINDLQQNNEIINPVYAQPKNNNDLQQSNQFISPTYVQPRNNGMAIASMILGIASIACCGLAGIVGIILGFVSHKKVKESNGAETGLGMAKAGIICGFIGVGIMLIYIIFYIIVIIVKINSPDGLNAPSSIPSV